MSPLAISLRFLQTQPDARLVELARAGHERAFEALIRRYRGQLLAYCRRVAPRGTAPEDILQQGLLQAWKALSAGSEVRDARAWLYRIVHNVAISALRASGELPEGIMAAPGAPGVDQLVEQRMAARDALAGLAALPDLQRQVMVSTALDGASHEEVAAALGLSSGSVRGLIYRARSTLRAAAAALVPPPVIEWALGDAGGASAGVAGGSAGLGALILKGSAILAVGAVAGTAAIVAGPHHRHHGHQAGIASAAGDRQAVPAASLLALPATGGTTGATRGAYARGGSPSPADATRSGSHDGSRGGGHGGSGDGGSGRQGSGGGSRSGGDGSGSGSSGTDGSRSGSDGGGDGAATTASSGSGSGDGGGDHSTTTATTGSDGGGASGTSGGGSTSGSDGGGSSSGSSDGGSSGGSDGGTTTTTTIATTSGH